MANFSDSMYTITSLEEMAEGQTFVHRLHPMVKIAITFLYLVLVVSFNPYNLTGLVVLAFYPAIMMALGEIPLAPLFKRMLIAVPFALFAGISNILFNHDPAFTVGTLTVTYGFISFCSILIKTVLTVTGVLILIATTPLPTIACQLLRLHLPKILVEQILLIYRYISVFLQEVSTMYTAYMLRAPGEKGVKMKDMGVFLGQLLLRSFDRAETIYYAMKCRGYDGRFLYAKADPLCSRDWLFLIATAALLLLLRYFNLSVFLGSLF